ncbi:MAG: YlmH/Sll1252 family protein [Eubacteriales bacterium]|nr:YlmH/Sll1252 family protein [Eubacteriales bacterium]
MNGEQDEAQVRRRLDEMATRCDSSGVACFSDFLSPPEAEWAKLAARKAQVSVTLCGGYEDAERMMACFSIVSELEEPFPIANLRLTWPHQSAPQHRDLLGSVMGLGIQRRCVGDIVVEAEQAFVFVEERLASHLKDNLLSAGKIHLQVEMTEELPVTAQSVGREVRDTVASLRLDAVLASGFRLSRASASELIRSGQVKLRHMAEQRIDAQVSVGSIISVRGYGRLALQEIGALTKKGRYPLTMLLYGVKK